MTELAFASFRAIGPQRRHASYLRSMKSRGRILDLLEVGARVVSGSFGISRARNERFRDGDVFRHSSRPER